MRYLVQRFANTCDGCCLWSLEGVCVDTAAASDPDKVCSHSCPYILACTAYAQQASMASQHGYLFRRRAPLDASRVPSAKPEAIPTWVALVIDFWGIRPGSLEE
eukprot:6149319-Pyramimonas_sp.AAC.1